VTKVMFEAVNSHSLNLTANGITSYLAR